MTKAAAPPKKAVVFNHARHQTEPTVKRVVAKNGEQ